ncbi:MAG: FecCD family ABC transporter permease [Enterococcus sp.]
MKNKRKGMILWLIVLLTLLIFGIALFFGAEQISFSLVKESIFNFDETDQRQQIIRMIRLPRVIGAFVVGSSFALSGALMQGVSRNPLADSGLLGINAGASLATALCFAFLPSATSGVVLFASLIGSFAVTFLVFGFLKLSRIGINPVQLLLAGVSISTFFTAISQALTQLFDLGQDLAFWFVGGAANIRWQQLTWTMPLFFIATCVAFALSKQISLVSLSDEHALSLGAHPQKIRLIVFSVVAVLAAIAVSLVGPVAFIGLMVPHVAKGIVGTNYRYLLPTVFFMGGCLVMLADLVARTINPPFETPFGLIIAIIGVPFLLVQVRRTNG